MTTTNKSFMATMDMATLYNDKTVEKIAKKLLINLVARGNERAYDVYLGKENNQCALEDITQSMYEILAMYPCDWYLFRSPHRYSTDEYATKLVFTNDIVSKEFFRVPSQIMYHNIRKHEIKCEYIQIDDDVIRANDIKALASHTSIDDVIALEEFRGFCTWLKDVKSKKAQRYINEMIYRLKGYEYKNIAIMLNIKDTSVKVDFHELKKLWNEYHNK